MRPFTRALFYAICVSILVLPASTLADKPPKNLLKGKPEWVQPGKHGVFAIEAEFDNSGPKHGEKTLRVELPDGHLIDLELDGFESLEAKHVVWRGREKGNKDSRATLTTTHGMIAGTIRIGEDIYEVRPKNKNKLIIELIDFSGMAACESDELPPINLQEGDTTILRPTVDNAVTAEEGTTHIIDLLSVYTNAAKTAAGGTEQIEAQIQAAVDAANTAFIDSDMTARFRLVHTQEISHDESGTADGGADLSWLRTNSAVGTIRDTYGADMVSLVVDRSGFCGVGYVQRSPGPSFSAWAFQVTDIDCMGANRTLAHEHGHNMGFEHNPENSSAHPSSSKYDGSTPSYPWSFAHYVNGQFRTIMSYSDPCTVDCSRIGQWSNPDIDFLSMPTGIDGQRDNARTGDLTAPITMLFRDTVVPPSGSSIENVQIVSGLDDVEEMTEDNFYLSTGYVDGSDIDLDMTNDSSWHNGDQLIGLRFLDLNIPWGSTILNSYLKFTSYYINSTAGTLIIHAEDTDSAAPFSMGQTNDVSGRTPTSTSVSWSPAPWEYSYVSKTSPSLNETVQQVIDRPGWLPDNDMSFLISGEGAYSVASYENDPTLAASLHVEYRSCDESLVLPASQLVSFSIPCNPIDSTIATLFSDLSLATYGMDWWIIDFGESTYDVQLKNPSDSLVGNRGYLYARNGGDAVTLSVNGKENRSHVIPLASDGGNGRMNFLGQPPRFTTAWSEVRVIDGGSELTLDQADPPVDGETLRACDMEVVHETCIMSRKMHKWNGSAYITSDGETPGMEGSVSQFEGYWVKAYKAGISLRVPDAPTSTDAEADEPIATYQSGEPWSVRLVVSSGELIDPGNAFGQLETASDSLDQHDLEELSPAGVPWLTLLFTGVEGGDDPWGYSSDFRAMTKKPKGSWDFVVRASSDVEEATLKWAGPEEVINNIRLYDEHSKKPIDISIGGEHTFKLVDGEARLRMEVKFNNGRGRAN